jgi:hypothetical protein
MLYLKQTSFFEDGENSIQITEDDRNRVYRVKAKCIGCGVRKQWRELLKVEQCPVVKHVVCKTCYYDVEEGFVYSNRRGQGLCQGLNCFTARVGRGQKVGKYLEFITGEYVEKRYDRLISEGIQRFKCYHVNRLCWVERQVGTVRPKFTPVEGIQDDLD